MLVLRQLSFRIWHFRAGLPQLCKMIGKGSGSSPPDVARASLVCCWRNPAILVLKWLQQSLSGTQGGMAVAKWKDESARVGVRDHGERFFETIVELLDDGIIVMGDDGSVKFVNPAARRILGLEPEQTLADFAERAAQLPLFDADGVPVPTELRTTGRPRLGMSFSRQIYAVDLSNGERRWLLINGCPVHLDDSDDVDVLISFSDVTSQHASVERLMHQANHDPLTGLPNRGYVLRRITEALAAADGVRFRAVLFID